MLDSNKCLLSLVIVLMAGTPTLADDIYTLGYDIDGAVKLEKQRKPYKLVRSIRVEEDAKLSIERGTKILAGPGVTIQLVGLIETFGDPEQLVTITSGNARQPWGGLRAQEGFTGEIKGLMLQGADIGVSFGQDAVQFGTITDCVIAGNRTGVRLDRSRERHQIRNTVIANNYEYGIVAHLAKYELDHCTIANNGKIGIFMDYYGDGKITNCSIGRNPTAIQSKLYATHLEMTGCNIVQNRHSVVVATKEEFRCRGNYWGTTNVVAIASSISDGYDKRGQGCVDFTEFVEKPFKDAGAQLEIKKR